MELSLKVVHYLLTIGIITIMAYGGVTAYFISKELKRKIKDNEN